VAVEAVLLVRNNSSSASQLSRSISCDAFLLTLNRQQQNEARQHILNQILHPEAADRLGRIRLVKEERAADIENRLITLAQTGQLRQKVTEEQLKELLNAMSESKEEEKIVVSRRKAWDDDDDLDL
jgi:DNA-binding TFAR19-related protein (PDSD5 family)